MSEEKMYAVKNDEGDWADRNNVFGYGAWVTPDKNMREEEAKHNGGHVVTLIEEPEKVVLTKEQAGIVEDAHYSNYPATCISINSSEDEEELLMNAYVNGYTVENEKQYNVKVPHTEDVWYYKTCDGNLMTISNKKLSSDFTESEIEHYGLQDCDKVEATDDEKNDCEGE